VTTINHALASSVGVWAATRVPAVAVEWINHERAASDLGHSYLGA